MLKLSYKHEVKDDGSVVLSDYRYADNEHGGGIMCEMIDSALVWHKEPDEFMRAVVEDEFIKVQSDWFLEFYGIKETLTKIPRISFEEWACKERGWL